MKHDNLQAHMDFMESEKEKKMNKRSIGFMLCVVFLSLSTLAAFAAAPVVLTCALADRTNVEDFNASSVTLWVEKTLNVDLRFNVYAANDFVNKMNLKVASGDPLEDLVFANSMGGPIADDIVYQWATNGALAPLTRYYKDKKVAANLYQAMDRVGYDFRGALTMPDGEIYYVPILNSSFSVEYPAKLWVYQPWLDKLGISAPTTTKEFQAVLKKVVTSDLNGNGKPDEVGMAGQAGVLGDKWFPWLMNAFVYTNPTNDFIKIENGKASFAFLEDAWREGIEYIASLIKDGCLPTQSVTQKDAEARLMLNTPDVTCFTIDYAIPFQVTDLARKTAYVAMPPLTGPKGVRYAMFEPSKPMCGMLVSSRCKNVEAAFRVGDVLVEERNSIVTRFGQEGKDWDYISSLPAAEQKKYISPYKGFPPYIVVYNDAAFWGSGSMQNRSWMQSGPFIRQYGIANGMGVIPEKVMPYDMNVANGICLYQYGPNNAGFKPKEYIIKLLYKPEESKIVADVRATLRPYLEETMSKWILGHAKLDDASWSQFKKTAESFGLAQMLKVVQAAYTRSLVK
jgi:putative aldouronate transport system substrate-binding protein